MRSRPAAPRPVFVLALLLALAPPAFAADWQTPSADRILGDPAFLPLAGQVEGGFEYSYGATLYNSNPFRPTGVDRSQNRFLPSLGYGITDDISVDATFGWGNTRTQNTFTQTFFVGLLQPPFFRIVSIPRKVDTRAIGAQNPVFGATWRVLDERIAPVNIDLSAHYAPDIFDARAAGVVQAGSIAPGGQRGTIEAAISRVQRLYTVRGFATFGYDGRRNQSLPGGTDSQDSSPHADYAIGLQSEVRPFPWVAVNSGVSLDYTPRYDLRDSASDFTETVRTGRTISPYVALVAPIVGNRLVGIVGYQHDFTGDEKLTSDGFTDQRFSNQETNLLYARLLFTFGR